LARSSKIKVRRWKQEDIPGIVACHKAAYADYASAAHYDERLYEMQFTSYPEGQCVADLDGKIVGYATSLIVQLDEETHRYTYEEITGAATFSTHDPSGDTLYGADIAVHPDCRGMGVAGQLYVYRTRIVKRHNLRRMVAYGRIPGYKEVAGKMTAEEYVERVTAGDRKDSALTAHLKAGYRVKMVLLDYVPDKSSLNYATLLEWKNPGYDAAKRKIAAAPIQSMARKIRVCAAQYLMRRISRWEEFEQTVDFFADTADMYHCHFLVLPEYFTAQLISTMPQDWPFDRAVRELAGLTDHYLEMFKKMAARHKIYIIGGSHPILRDGLLYNVAHLFTPAGKVYTQDKLHITPGEREDWGVHPGLEIKVFDTPLARIAIQICYDIEFPEVARLLAHSGVEVVFVPFSTDEKKAYYRVRYTAQARAVENYYYVVIAGNVGNLPTIKNYLLNYGQSAIFTPSDFAFPLESIAGEADPNVETVVVAELDLSTLAQQRELGSVRPFFDCRPDLYELRARDEIRVIRTN
jgi:predicted amidohydrolase/ribosomal protein S18 acetylase RimI-like enzyme